MSNQQLLIVLLVLVVLILLSLIPIFYFTFRDYFSQFRLRNFNTNQPLARSRDQIDALIEEIIGSVSYFNTKKIGCLIILCAQSNLNHLITDEGVEINGNVSADLIKCIFSCKEVQLHDGALLIDRNWKIRSCSVFFRIKKMFRRQPVKKYGTRHLVARQVAYDSDAAIIVVSETNGQITFIHNKKLSFDNINLDFLRQKLKERIYD